MPEIPEIKNLSRQINNELTGKEIAKVNVIQEKCLNMDVESFIAQIQGMEVLGAYNKGKWIFIKLTESYYLLLNLGMGGDVVYYRPGERWNEQYQCRFHFDDDSGFTCRFWWFGHIELLKEDELSKHTKTNNIAIDPYDEQFTFDYFKGLFKSKVRVKNILVNQKKIGGIGNAYVHDILFLSGVHPMEGASNLSEEQISKLYSFTKDYLEKVILKRGLAYEKDFYGRHGSFDIQDFFIGYHENEKCPICNNIILKMKTGTTSSYVCTKCQPLISG